MLNSSAFPVIPGLGVPARTIYCIGRNYAEHAKELKNEVPQEPVVFLKPLSSLVFEGGSIMLPKQSSSVHHEVEIVVAIGKTVRDASEAEAREAVLGFGVGIDVTARDLQEKAKAKALPWSVAKGFDTFAALSAFVPRERVTDWSSLELGLNVNGGLRQKGSSSQMLFPIPTLVQYLSSVFTLYPGDLIYTGTPAGVAQLQDGDHLEAVLTQSGAGVGVGGSALCTLRMGVKAQKK